MSVAFANRDLSLNHALNKSQAPQPSQIIWLKFHEVLFFGSKRSVKVARYHIKSGPNYFSLPTPMKLESFGDYRVQCAR